ncbi:MAG TPA: peptidylprolyl isomerase [Acidobacteriota bacterium]|nr:peptidylprolyl isomerase [Acidobacteriota bacterium]
MNRTMMKAVLVVVLLMAGLQVSGEEVLEAIVAVVNQDVITLSDFKQQDEMLYQSLSSRYQGEELENIYRKSRKSLLDSMITDLLLLQEAEKQNIDVSGQIEKMLEDMKEQYGFSSIEEIRRAMGEQGINFDSWLDFQERELLKEGVIFYSFGKDIVVDDNEVINYYRQHQEEFKEQATFELKTIYLSDTGKIEQEIQGKMNEINSKLKAGDSFEDLAEKYSDGPYKETRGELGSFKKGTLDKTLEQAVEKIEVGEVTPWIKTTNGWYLLKLVDKEEEHIKDFDEVRGEIERKIFEKKRKEKTAQYIEDLRERSYVEIKIKDPYKLF